MTRSACQITPQMLLVKSSTNYSDDCCINFEIYFAMIRDFSVVFGQFLKKRMICRHFSAEKASYTDSASLIKNHRCITHPAYVTDLINGFHQGNVTEVQETGNNFHNIL